jgi:hypothetical protein
VKIAIALLALFFLTSCRDTRGCEIIEELPQPVYFDRMQDYLGVWTDDFGIIIGYSVQEDSTIYEELSCLK